MDGMEIAVPLRAENGLAAEVSVDNVPVVVSHANTPTEVPPPLVRYLKNRLLEPPAHTPKTYGRASTGHERGPEGKRVNSPCVMQWSPSSLPQPSDSPRFVPDTLRDSNTQSIASTREAPSVGLVQTPPELVQHERSQLWKKAKQRMRTRVHKGKQLPDSNERIQQIQQEPVRAVNEVSTSSSIPNPTFTNGRDGYAIPAQMQSKSPADVHRDDISPQPEHLLSSRQRRPATTWANPDISTEQQVAAPMNDDTLFDQFSWADAPLDKYASASSSAKRDLISDPDLAEQPHIALPRRSSLESNTREPARHARAPPFDVDSVNASLFGIAPRRPRSLEVVTALQRNEHRHASVRAERQVARLRGLHTGSGESQGGTVEELVEDRDRAGNVVRRRKLVAVRSRIPPDALR